MLPAMQSAIQLQLCTRGGMLADELTVTGEENISVTCCHVQNRTPVHVHGGY
jgi:hypothetical protein